MYENNDTIDYAEVFGDDISEDTGADDASVGENEDAEVNTEADVDDNAESSDDNVGEAEADTDIDTVTEDGIKKQSRKDNSRFAAARREAERQRDAAIAEAEERHKKELENVFTAVGLTNPYTGKPVTNMDELAAYNKAISDDKKKTFMEKNGLSEDEYNRFIGELPEVAEARRMASEAEAAKRSAKDAKAKANIDEQVAIISKLNPDIKSVDDLIRDESYETILPLVKKGYAVSDAYRIANFDKLTSAAAASARQQERNSQISKEHLTQSDSRGSGIESVPADIRAQYREFNPDMTDAEIAKEYAKYIKQTRKNN